MLTGARSGAWIAYRGEVGVGWKAVGGVGVRKESVADVGSPRGRLVIELLHRLRQ